jgi:glutathione S-transferase
MTSVTLTGYRHSIYTRIARMVLHAKGVTFAETEADPFSPPLPPDHPHPFGRVPILSHDGFTVFETSAIARYIDLAFPGPALVPTDARAAARMAQVIAIADAYAFRPLVLQVFAHAVFRPLEARVPDTAQITEGLAAAPSVLAALEDIARKGLVLTGSDITLADCHLAPMIAAFTSAAEGAALLAQSSTLARWWARVREHPSFLHSGRPLPTG